MKGAARPTPGTRVPGSPEENEKGIGRIARVRQLAPIIYPKVVGGAELILRTNSGSLNL